MVVANNVGNTAKNYRRRALALSGGIAAIVAVVAAWWFLNRAPGSTPKLQFELKDETGRSVFLTDFISSAILVVHFWATWCAPCVDELPELLKFAEKRSDVKVVLISLDEDWKTAHKILPSKFSANVVSLLDPNAKLATSWGSYQYPETYLFGRGEVRAKLVGPQDWHAAIETLR